MQQSDLPTGLQAGFVVSKKVSPRSYKRHRVRRLAREAFRLLLKNTQLSLPENLTLVFILRNTSLGASFSEFQEQMLALQKVITV
jgi:ribonuclease P protein component